MKSHNVTQKLCSLLLILCLLTSLSFAEESSDILPKYTAYSYLYVASIGTVPLLFDSDWLKATFTTLLHSCWPLAEEIRHKLDLSYTYSFIQSILSIEVVPNTNILRLSCTANDPYEAMDICSIALTVVVEACSEYKVMGDNVSVDILSSPLLPSVPD